MAFLPKCQAKVSEDKMKTKCLNRHIMETNTNCLWCSPLFHPPQLSAEIQLRSHRDFIEGSSHFAPVPGTAARKLWNLCGEKPRNSNPLPKLPGLRGQAGPTWSHFPLRDPLEKPPLITTSAGASSRHSNIKTQGRVCPPLKADPEPHFRHCQLNVCDIWCLPGLSSESLTPKVCQVLDFYENKNRGHEECPGNFDQCCDKSHHQEKPMVSVLTSASRLALAAEISGNLSVPRGREGLIGFSLNVESNMTKMLVQRPSPTTAPHPKQVTLSCS